MCHAGRYLRNGPSVAIVAQTSLVYRSVHTAIDPPSSIIMSHSNAANVATMRLTSENHHKAMQLELDFLKATTKSKFVYIRDELAIIFQQFILKWRLHGHEVGIHPKTEIPDTSRPVVV